VEKHSHGIQPGGGKHRLCKFKHALARAGRRGIGIWHRTDGRRDGLIRAAVESILIGPTGMHTPAGVEALIEFGVRGALCPGVMLLGSQRFSSPTTR